MASRGADEGTGRRIDHFKKLGGHKRLCRDYPSDPSAALFWARAVKYARAKCASGHHFGRRRLMLVADQLTSARLISCCAGGHQGQGSEKG